LLNQRVGLIVSHSVSKEFLYQLLKNTSFLIAMTGEAKGGAQGNLSKNDILNYQIALPADPEEQTAIATVLSDMDAEIEALERRRDKTKQIKQGMMQELLTGRTRLVEAQATEAEQ
jgi:type I restriction enzyme S subunit